MAKTMVTMRCERPGCTNEFTRVAYEIKRNKARGRKNTCSRHCQAIVMNKSPKKLENTRAILAERNANNWRENNPNWKGGNCGKLKPLPEGK